MTPDDMLFGEIALRLQLLSREQIERCIRYREERGSTMSLREVAIELGLIGEVDANLIESQRARTLERREAARRSRAPSAPAAGADAQARATGEHVNQRWSAPGTGAGTEPDARGTGERVNQRWGTPDTDSEARSTGERVNQRWGAVSAGGAPTTAPPAHAQAATSAAATLPRSPAARPPSVPMPGASLAQDDPAFLAKAFGIAVAHGASDLHLHADAVPMMRLAGRLVPLPGASVLNAERTRTLIAALLTEAQRAMPAARGQLDFASTVGGAGRARVSAYHQQHGLDAVLHLVPSRTPKLDELDLPRAVGRLTGARSGLILCTGPRGSGKTTTLAALLGAMIASRPDHVITIEDPIEHVFEPGRALVNQREVGTHTGSVARALRAALREDPDILLVGELRDVETLDLALTAAETGHLVLGELPITGTLGAIQHLIGVFPSEDREHARAMLSESLHAILDQRLVQRATGTGRVPAVEIAIATPTLRNLIRQDRLPQWSSTLQAGRADGMLTLEDSLADLVRTEAVTAEAAGRVSHKRERMGAS